MSHTFWALNFIVAVDNQKDGKNWAVKEMRMKGEVFGMEEVSTRLLRFERTENDDIWQNCMKN